jgi:hypothetical protein
MLGIATLTAAVRQLAGNLAALAETVGQVNANIRARLLLDGPEEPAQIEGPTDVDPVSPSKRKRQPA